MATKNNTTKIVIGIGVVIIITGAILYIRKMRLNKLWHICNGCNAVELYAIRQSLINEPYFQFVNFHFLVLKTGRALSVLSRSKPVSKTKQGKGKEFIYSNISFVISFLFQQVNGKKKK